MYEGPLYFPHVCLFPFQLVYFPKHFQHFFPLWLTDGIIVLPCPVQPGLSHDGTIIAPRFKSLCFMSSALLEGRSSSKEGGLVTCCIADLRAELDIGAELLLFCWFSLLGISLTLVYLGFCLRFS